MIPQNLTSTQSEKLIEMCREAFPKTAFYNLTQNNVITFFDLTNDVMIDIHWFELCLVHLPKHIWNFATKMRGKGVIAHHQSMMLSETIDFKTKEPIHPVDYLYTMYKNRK